MSSIEAWYEQIYPSFVLLGQNGVTYDPEDKRTAVIKLEEKCAAQAKHYPNGSSSESFPWELMAFVGGAIDRIRHPAERRRRLHRCAGVCVHPLFFFFIA
jgi:hypothetical protein